MSSAAAASLRAMPKSDKELRKEKRRKEEQRRVSAHDRLCAVLQSPLIQCTGYPFYSYSRSFAQHTR
jgi:hypothetical protein